MLGFVLVRCSTIRQIGKVVPVQSGHAAHPRALLTARNTNNHKRKKREKTEKNTDLPVRLAIRGVTPGPHVQIRHGHHRAAVREGRFFVVRRLRRVPGVGQEEHQRPFLKVVGGLVGLQRVLAVEEDAAVYACVLFDGWMDG